MLSRADAVHLFFESEAADLRCVAPSAQSFVAPTGASILSEQWVGGGEYVAWLGRYDIHHKGLDLLFGALAAMPPERRPRLVTHGRDSLDTRESVEKLAADLGLENSVAVRGPISGTEKLLFLTHAAAYVHPSRWECHSLALLEALSLGMPVVLSAGAHIAADIRRNAAAIVVEPTTQGLASGLMAIERSPEAFGANARRFVVQSFSWDAAVDAFLSQVPRFMENRQA